MEFPPFSALPLKKDGPRGNAWGLFGDGDELGMLNLLTPENTAAAAREIVDGTRVSTDWPLNAMARPCFGRLPMEHKVILKTPRTIHDDSLTFNTQGSSQWDGFRHYAYQDTKQFFGGRTVEDCASSTVVGTDAWVKKGGIVGRGVLLDWLSWAESQDMEIPYPFSTHSIPVSQLDAVAKAQGTELRHADILFVRTGWVSGYQKLTDEKCKELADMSTPPAIGLQSSEETLRWLWERRFAAVVGDHPSMEAWPCQDERFWLHEWLLAGWGCPIGEIFDLEELAVTCKAKKRWSFFFSSVPLKVPGGVASPPNGVAIF